MLLSKGYANHRKFVSPGASWHSPTLILDHTRSQGYRICGKVCIGQWLRLAQSLVFAILVLQLPICVKCENINNNKWIDGLNSKIGSLELHQAVSPVIASTGTRPAAPQFLLLHHPMNDDAVPNNKTTASVAVADTAIFDVDGSRFNSTLLLSTRSPSPSHFYTKISSNSTTTTILNENTEGQKPIYNQPLFVADMGIPSSDNALQHILATRRPSSARSPTLQFNSSAPINDQSKPALKPMRVSSPPSPTQPMDKSALPNVNHTEKQNGRVTDTNNRMTTDLNQTKNSSSDTLYIDSLNSTSLLSINITSSVVSVVESIPSSTSNKNKTYQDSLHKISMNAWSWHYHVFGIAFCLLGILSSYSLLHFVFCLSVLQRMYFLLSNVGLCLFCFFRCSYILRANAYRDTSLSYVIIMYEAPTVLITLATMLLFGGACTFSEVHWWKFRPIKPLTVNSFVIPYTAVMSALLISIVVVFNSWSNNSDTVFYLILFQKIMNILWSLTFVLLSWALYSRLYKDSLRKQSQILRTALTKLHIEGTQLPKNIPKPCLCLCVRSLCVTSCLLLIFNSLLVYGLVYSEDMVLSLYLGKASSPSWWIYRNVMCVFEVGICACLACGHCWSHCGHQCRSAVGKWLSNCNFRKDVWHTSTRRLRRLSEHSFRRRQDGGAGVDSGDRVGGVAGSRGNGSEDYEAIERLAGGGERDSEFPSVFFGVYGNNNSRATGHGVSTSTHFTFERWERSNYNGSRAVATNTLATDMDPDPTIIHPSLSRANPQQGHHYLHTATVRPVLKTFQRLSQVSPQRLQAQLRSSTLALQRRGRNVSSAVVSGLKSLAGSRRSSSSSCSSGTVGVMAASGFGLASAGQHGLSVTPIKFSTSPRMCGLLGHKADYVNVPTSAMTTMALTTPNLIGKNQKHNKMPRQKLPARRHTDSDQDGDDGDGLLVMEENHLSNEIDSTEVVSAMTPEVSINRGHAWFSFQQPSARKRHLNKRLTEKSSNKRKSRNSTNEKKDEKVYGHHANRNNHVVEDKEGNRSFKIKEGVSPVGVPYTGHHHYQNNKSGLDPTTIIPLATTMTTNTSSLTSRQMKMDKRSKVPYAERSHGKVKEFANKVLMVSRATQVYIPSPCKNISATANTQDCFSADQQMHQNHQWLLTESSTLHKVSTVGTGPSISLDHCTKSSRSHFLLDASNREMRGCLKREDGDAEEEDNEKEFEYEDDRDLLSAVNKYKKPNSCRHHHHHHRQQHHNSAQTPTVTPHHNNAGSCTALPLVDGQLRRSWHMANSSTSCSSESAANSFDVRFYVYSPSPGEASPDGSTCSPSRDFHDHFYPKLYQRNQKCANSSGHYDCADLTAGSSMGSAQCEFEYPRTRFHSDDPYATVNKSNADDSVTCKKSNFLPLLKSSSLILPPNPSVAMQNFQCTPYGDIISKNKLSQPNECSHHYAATDILKSRNTLDIMCKANSCASSSGSNSSRPPSGGSGQSRKDGMMYLSGDDEDEFCCSAAHQLHPNNLNLSLALEKDAYYPTVVNIKSKNPQDITPDSAVYLELNSPQTVDTPPTIREHPLRFPFPSPALMKTGPLRTIANKSGAIALKKSASFGNLLQFNKTHHHQHHRDYDEQRQQVVLQTPSDEKSINPAVVQQYAAAFPSQLKSSISLERLQTRGEPNCCICSEASAPSGKLQNDLKLCSHQVRWRRWLSADELELCLSNSDSVYDSKDSVSFPSNDVDGELDEDACAPIAVSSSVSMGPPMLESRHQSRFVKASKCS